MKLNLSILVFLFSLSLNAQISQGKITYTQTIKLDFETPPEMKTMGKEMPKKKKRFKELYFNQSGSLFKDSPKKERSSQEPRKRRRNKRSKDNQYYKDLKSETIVNKKDLMGKSFLITDEPKMVWKLSGEQKAMMDYLCMKATTIQDSVEIIAWFTPQIPLPIGPAQFHGLPGAILSLESIDGKMTMIASEITLNDSFEIEIKAPIKGEAIGYIEYKKLEQEKMEERQKMRKRGRRQGQHRRGF